jgi:uncharacterized protein
MNFVSIRCSIIYLFLAFGLLGCMTMPLKERGLVPGAAGTVLDIASASEKYPVFQFSEHKIKLGDGHLYSVCAIQKRSKVTVLFFGGNQFTIEKWSENILNYYQHLNVNVVLVDHAGYGASSGKPSLSTLFQGALASYDEIKTWTELSDAPIIVHGHSLGSFLAGHVAENRKLSGLILEGSATTTEEWIKMYPKGLSGLFIRKFDIAPELQNKGNLALMSKLDEPILIAVGEKDSQTPPVLSQKLFAAIGNDVRKALLVVPRGTHMNAAWGVAYRDAFEQSFLCEGCSHVATDRLPR